MVNYTEEDLKKVCEWVKKQALKGNITPYKVISKYKTHIYKLLNKDKYKQYNSKYYKNKSINKNSLSIFN